MPLIIKIIFVLSGTAYISFLINLIQNFFASHPIKEEKSTPVYITKEL